MIKDTQFAIPISYGTTEVIDTGKWGFQKPHPQFMTAPCQEACPAGNNIPRFIYQALKGEYREALSTLLKESPFPGVCGRVCFHPCEESCNRSQYDEPVSVCALERHTFDNTIDLEHTVTPLQNPAPKKIAVIGGGPSGLSCAYFLSLLGHTITVFEARQEAGGLMTYGIPEYRLPKHVVKKEIARIMDLGVEIRTGVRVGADISFDALGSYDAIYLSVGAGMSSVLNIDGERLDHVRHGLEFLADIDAGSTEIREKDVLVIGGGNTAMDVARSSLRLGSRVTVAYRRTRAQMPAFREEIDDAEEEGARFEFLIQPVGIAMLPGRRLVVTFQRMKLGEPDRTGRAGVIPIEGSLSTMETDYLFVAAGENVDHLSIPSGLTKDGLVQVDPFLRTQNNRIFAGGDVVDQPRTIVTAIGAGKKAAISIDLYLKGSSPENIFSDIGVGGKGSLSFEAYATGGRFEMFRAPRKVVTYDKLNTLYFEHSERVNRKKVSREDALKDFREVNRGLSENEAEMSASRCFACGTCNYCYNCYFFCPEGVIRLDPEKETKYVDYEHCKGCGTCARSCPRSVVIMKEL
jgi:NADPH-dependent glutamate synthase beta subunit-like oxidoreductase